MAHSDELLCPRCEAELRVCAIGGSMVTARCTQCSFHMSGHTLFGLSTGEAERNSQARDWARLQLKGHERCTT